jgi:hypothetical protein
MTELDTTPALRPAVHFVGSIPLTDAAEVFRTVADVIGSCAPRIPDGETDERRLWVGSQVAMLAANPALEPVLENEGEAYDRTRLQLRADHDPAQIELHDLGYARAALDSYAKFAELKATGIFPDFTRFQVSLPTPLAPLIMGITRRDQLAIEPLYRRAMLRELAKILDAIPHDQLAVQWDISPEIGLLEGVWEAPFDDVLDEVSSRIVDLAGAVSEDVELGFHFCYGDLGHRHFVQPRDTTVIVTLANAVIAGLRRRLHWMHLPVPIDRTDVAYFVPLRELALPVETQLFVGLVHEADGVLGAASRVAAASTQPHGFGIATECGLGRRDPASIPALLALHREILDELMPNPLAAQE